MILDKDTYTPFISDKIQPGADFGDAFVDPFNNGTS